MYQTSFSHCLEISIDRSFRESVSDEQKGMDGSFKNYYQSTTHIVHSNAIEDGILENVKLFVANGSVVALFNLVDIETADIGEDGGEFCIGFDVDKTLDGRLLLFDCVVDL